MAQGKPVVLSRADWASHDTLWKGRVEGRRIGAGVTVLFYATDEIGAGPRLHVHPYDEIFIVREGRALFTVGEDRFECEAGAIVFGPAGIPHMFKNLGPGRLETTDIHLNDRFIQTDLPEQEAAGDLKG
ncbi:MAG TPA: cupin domain-containing protein [Microvirga sp.]|jgi:mannose-6-phosphate isomerase-like protein (cupin superfamily)